MENFKSRKWLLGMAVGYECLLPVSKATYVNIKNTCHQLKKLGYGEWLCSKKGGIGDSYTLITRIR